MIVESEGGHTETDLILQGSQVPLEPLMFAQQGLNTGQVTSEIVRGHELLFLFDPADGFVHIPAEQKKEKKKNLGH